MNSPMQRALSDMEDNLRQVRAVHGLLTAIETHPNHIDPADLAPLGEALFKALEALDKSHEVMTKGLNVAAAVLGKG